MLVVPGKTSNKLVKFHVDVECLGEEEAKFDFRFQVMMLSKHP